MTPWYAGIALQAVVVAAALLVFGYLLADAILRRSPADRVVRWALAFPSLAGFGIVLMLAHVVTGGAVLSNATLVRTVTAAAAAGLAADRALRTWRDRGGTGRPASSGIAIVVAGAAAVVALAVWGEPLLRMFPLGRPAADTGWHTGWTSQLLNGLSTPTAPITGDVPNYYPWGFHGVLAWVTRLTPGGTAFHGLGPLHLAQVAGAALGLFALGREVGRRWADGAAVAVAASMSAGLGVLLWAAPSLLERTPQTGGPRLTYHAAWHHLPPALPRDVAFTLLIAVLLLAARGLASGRPGWFAAAGAAAGAAGLVSAESFFVALGVAVLLCVPSSAVPRHRRAALLLGPALMVWAAWAAPLGASYARLGGFVNTTILDPPTPSPFEVLLSWGWTIPFVAWGLWRWAPRTRRDPAASVPLALVVAAGLAVAGSAAIPSLFGEGFSVLGRARRYWPILHLGVAILAGLGAADLLVRIRGGGRAGIIRVLPVAVLGLALALPLPLRVSWGLPSATPRSPAVESALRGDQGALAAILRETGGERPCVVAAPPRESVGIFATTGYRLVRYAGRQAAREGNAARIRWRDIYEVVPPESERFPDNDALTGGTVGAPELRRLAERHGVDLIVAEPEAPEAPYAQYELAGVSGEGLRVYRTGDCS